MNETKELRAAEGCAPMAGSAGLVRIHWVNSDTGACGCGDPIARSVAEACLRDVVPRYPEIQHWIADA